MATRRVNRKITETEMVRESVSQSLAAPVAFLLLVLALAALAIDRVVHPEAFPVSQVHYRGDFHYVAPDEIEAAVLPVVHGNMLVLDLHDIEKAAESVPWVDHATVRRRWPKAIQVSVVEHTPVARWDSGGWVTRSGDVVDNPRSAITGRLPVLSGPGGTQNRVLDHYRNWATILAPVGLRVDELALSDRGAWKLQVRVTDKGVARPAEPMVDAGMAGLDPQPVVFSLVVGRHEAQERIARFSRVYRHSLLSRISWVDLVDLRHTNGFSVRWIPIQEEEEGTGGASSVGPKKA